MNNITYLNGKYRFDGLKITKDNYSYDLIFSETPCKADKMFIYPLSIALQNQENLVVEDSPIFSPEELSDMFINRDKPNEDFKEFLSSYEFPPIYEERSPYVSMTGPFANSTSLWEIVYPKSISSFGLIEPKKFIRDGFILKSPSTKEIIGTIDYLTFQLYKSLETANAIWNHSTQIQKYRLLEDIQNQSLKANVKIATSLQNIRVEAPNRIIPDVKQNEDNFQLTAELDLQDLNQEDFEKHFEARNQTDNIYSVKDKNGNEVKVLLTDEQKQVLADIKNQKNATTDEIKEFISSPPPNWNDDIVDTSKLYGERVIGWHLYTPDFELPELGPYNNGWYNNANEMDNQGKLSLARKDQETKQKLVMDIKDNEEFLDYEKENANKLKSYIVPKIPGGYRTGISAKPYQNQGIAWMYSLYSNGNPGCILADDMGLGKTFQVLSFLQSVSEKPHLVLVATPASLIENWENEYYKFFSNYKYRIVTKNHSFSVLTEIISNQVSNKPIDNSYLFITNYESLRAIKEYLKVQWDIVVLDEAQRIKNPLSLTNKTARGLKTSFRIAITGTPVENNFSDIWAISDFACPGALGTHTDFKRNYDITEKDTNETLLDKGAKIRQTLGESFLRRTKQDTLDNLPEKEVIKLEEFMPSLQENAYKQALSLSAKHVSLVEKLMILQMLRKTSDHYALLGSQFDSEVYNFTDTARTLILKQILYSIREKNEKVLIFAEYIKTQEILAEIIYNEFGVKPSIYNGTVPLHSREPILKRFKGMDGFNIIIMSPIAAGVGLTITEANHVIHYSRHWNPAKEDQATDRVYRIGQKKKVYVYNLISRIEGIKTFDEKLDILLSRKQHIKGAALFPSNNLDIKEEDFVNELIN